MQAENIRIRKNLKSNPLAKWPRNAPCFCGSMKKSKKCCLPKVGTQVEEKDLPAVRQEIAKRAALYGVDVKGVTY